MERLIPDDGCQFGIGAFETILVWNGCPVFLEEHLNRLAGAMEALGLLSAGGQKEPGGAAERKRWKEHFREEIRGYLSGKEEKEGGLKLMVSEKNVRLSVRKFPYREEQYRKGFSLGYSWVRRNETSPFTYFKTFNYGDSIMARRAAAAAGLDEVLFLNSRGEICEGSVSNVFFVSETGIITPPVSCGLLDGIVRRYVMKVRQVKEQVVTPEMIPEFREMFVTNSLLGIMPAARLGNHEFPSMETARELRAEYLKLLEENTGKGAG